MNLELEATRGERSLVHLVKWIFKKPLRKICLKCNNVVTSPFLQYAYKIMSLTNIRIDRVQSNIKVAMLMTP